MRDLSCTPKIPICSMDETKIIPSIYASREDPESESRISRDSILLFFLSKAAERLQRLSSRMELTQEPCLQAGSCMTQQLSQRARLCSQLGVGALGKYASLPLAYQWVTLLRRQPWSLNSGALGAWQSAAEELTSRNCSTKRKCLASTTFLPPVSSSWPFAPVLFHPPPSRLPVPKRGGQCRGGWGSQPVI
jgi:hypothetical protein